MTTIDLRTTDLDQRLSRFTGLRDNRWPAPKSAPDIARVVAETAGAGSTAISRQFEAVRAAAENERQQTLDAMNDMYQQSTHETDAMFKQSAYFGLFLTHYMGNEPKNVLIENNMFETTKQSNGQDAPYSMMVADYMTRLENYTFRNNTFESEVSIGQGTPVNIKIVGNIGVAASCKGGVTYSYNVWTSGPAARPTIRPRTLGSTSRTGPRATGA